MEYSSTCKSLHRMYTHYGAMSVRQPCLPGAEPFDFLLNVGTSKNLVLVRVGESLSTEKVETAPKFDGIAKYLGNAALLAAIRLLTGGVGMPLMGSGFGGFRFIDDLSGTESDDEEPATASFRGCISRS